MHRMQEVTYVDFFMNCNTWSGEIINNEREKCDELRWVNINQLTENAIPYVAKALNLSEGSMSFQQLNLKENKRHSNPA